MPVVTLDGPTGGGGRLLGPHVARRLDADYVDRLVLTEAARHLGATVEALHQREENLPSRAERFSGMLQRVMERSVSTGMGSDPYFGTGGMAFLTEEFDDLPQPAITKGHELEDDVYVEAISKVIVSLADRGNVVMVGRGSSIILSDRPDVLRVGLVAGLDDMVTRVMKTANLTRDQAEKVVSGRDDARAHYFKRYFGLDHPDALETDHLVINTSAVDMEYATNLIVDAYKALAEGRLSSLS